MTPPWRVVVVGGGVAGLEVATGLGRRLGRRGEAEITLVDKALAHVWKPMLHQFAAGVAHADREKIAYAAQAHDNGFRFVAGTLDGVDREARRVKVTPYRTGDGEDAPLAGGPPPLELSYDRLVLAIGSRADDFGIEGVAEHCWTIDDLEGSERIWAELRRLVMGSIQRRDPISVGIVGGGATGVELAAEAKRAVHLIARYGYPDLPRQLRIVLIESGPRLLPAFPDGVAQAATRNLQELGVDVRTGAEVSAATADGFRLADGEHVGADLRVWAAGVKAPRALERLEGVARSKTGQVVVDDRLRAGGDDAVLVLGDCGELTPPGADKPIPATAQAARQEARHLVRHLRAWRRDGVLPPFRYHDRGAIVSLSDYNGWGTLGRYTFGGGWLKGLSARWLYALLYRQHQFELRGWPHGLAAWGRDGIDHWISPPVRLD